jgi:hypothetical protein
MFDAVGTEINSTQDPCGENMIVSMHLTPKSHREREVIGVRVHALWLEETPDQLIVRINTLFTNTSSDS